MTVEPFLRPAADLLAGVARASWQACVLAALVLALQRVLGSRLSARARYNLWLLVVLRLALPVTPPSPWSVWRLLNLPGSGGPSAVAAAPPAAEVQLPRDPAPVAGGAMSFQPDRSAAPYEKPAPVLISPTAINAADQLRFPRPRVSPPPPVSPSFWKSPVVPELWHFLGMGAAAVWAGGVVILSLRVARATGRFNAAVRSMRPVGHPRVLAVAEACRRELNLRRSPVLLYGIAVDSPALVGWFRPKLLLPEDAAVRLDDHELRLVLLHEMAHAKRGDVAANWVLAAVGIAHWLNPLVRPLLRRVRADRELACDEAVLAAAGRQDRRAYGRVLLKLLESLAHTAGGAGGDAERLTNLSPEARIASRLLSGRPGYPGAAGVVGILERDAARNLIRRITMIARFDPATPHRRRWSVLAAALAGALGATALTDTTRPAAAEPVPPAGVAETPTPRDGGATTASVTRTRSVPVLSKIPGVSRLFTTTEDVADAAPVEPPPLTLSRPVAESPGAEERGTRSRPAPEDVHVLLQVTPDAATEADGPRLPDRIAKAKAAFGIAQERAQLQERQAERMVQLAEQGAVSSAQAEKSRAEAEVAKMELLNAKTQLDRAATNLAALRARQDAAARRSAAPQALPLPAPPPAVPAAGGPQAVTIRDAPVDGIATGMAVAGGTLRAGEPPVMRAYDVGDLLNADGGAMGQQMDVAAVSQLVERMFSPGGRTPGGPTPGVTVGVFRNKLIVRASEANQKEVAALLDMLRADAGGKAAGPPRAGSGLRPTPAPGATLAPAADDNLARRLRARREPAQGLPGGAGQTTPRPPEPSAAEPVPAPGEGGGTDSPIETRRR